LLPSCSCEDDISRDFAKIQALCFDLDGTFSDIDDLYRGAVRFGERPELERSGADLIMETTAELVTTLGK